MESKNEPPVVAIELVGRSYMRKPVTVHAYELDRHADRILCGRAEASYSVAVDRRWSEPQPVERCPECAELIVRAARSAAVRGTAVPRRRR